MAAVLCHLDVVPEGDGWTVPPYEWAVLLEEWDSAPAVQQEPVFVCSLWSVSGFLGTVFFHQRLSPVVGGGFHNGHHLRRAIILGE